MNSKLRAKLRRAMPVHAKQAIQSFRKIVGQPPIDEAVLADYRFVSSANTRSRMTLVMPNLSKSEAFGGVTTGIDIFLNLTKAVAATQPLDLRLILTDSDQSTDVALFTSRAARSAFEPDDLIVQCIKSQTEHIEVRKDEIFVTYNWWTTLNIEPLLCKQSEHFEQPRKPLLYLIQEYEPVIFPFSSGHMLAREAYETPARLWGIFNSNNLLSYFKRQDHSVEREWVFQPVINDQFRPFVDEVATAERKPQILIYGRPNVNRNCFSALIRGLKHWSAEYPEYAEWDVVSAGTPHETVDIGAGRSVHSLGKLPLEDYAQTLLESSVGVSLMASPHPSYPPLEMAHFGLRVVTNSYTCKDLSGFHPNIVSLNSISASSLAKGIVQACKASDQPPSKFRNTEFMRIDKYPFIDDLVSSLLPELSGES